MTGTSDKPGYSAMHDLRGLADRLAAPFRAMHRGTGGKGRLRVMHLNDLSEDDSRYLARHGIIAEHVQNIHANGIGDEVEKARLLGLDAPDGASRNDGFAQSLDADALLADPEVIAAVRTEVERNERFLAYLRTREKNGTFAVHGVFSGDLLCADGSYVTTRGEFSTIAYRFRDTHDFHVIANGVYGHLWAV